MDRWESGQGLRREARGSEMFFKATGATTGGRFSLTRFVELVSTNGADATFSVTGFSLTTN